MRSRRAGRKVGSAGGGAKAREPRRRGGDACGRRPGARRSCARGGRALVYQRTWVLFLNGTRRWLRGRGECAWGRSSCWGTRRHPPCPVAGARGQLRLAVPATPTRPPLNATEEDRLRVSRACGRGPPREDDGFLPRNAAFQAPGPGSRDHHSGKQSRPLVLSLGVRGPPAASSGAGLRLACALSRAHPDREGVPGRLPWSAPLHSWSLGHCCICVPWERRRGAVLLHGRVPVQPELPLPLCGPAPLRVCIGQSG